MAMTERQQALTEAIAELRNLNKQHYCDPDLCCLDFALTTLEALLAASPAPEPEPFSDIVAEFTRFVGSAIGTLPNGGYRERMESTLAALVRARQTGKG